MPSRPRLEDVAARAGVSTASASLVLRGKPGPAATTREAVLRAAREIGYRPDAAASLLARRRTQLLGVTMQVSSPFHAELVEEIQASADARGYDVVVSPLTRTRGERRAVESLLDFRCEGLLLLAPAMSAPDLAELGERLAVVALGRRVTSPGVDVVRAADDVGVGLAVDHLAALGHRSIAFVDGPRGPIATLRRQGYRSAMKRVLGAASAESVPGGRIVQGGDHEADGARAVDALLDDRPSAVVAFNDRCALGVLDRLRRLGLTVPGDVSVVGFDDTPVARLATIDLTTVSQAPHAMAEAAVAAAVERLEGHRSTPADVVLEPHLVVRGTTGRLGAQAD